MNNSIKVIISPLVGTKNYSMHEGKELVLPCVPQIGSVIEIGSDNLEVKRVFYIYKEGEYKVYLSVTDWN